MKPTQDQLLRFLLRNGGEVNTYPFIECGWMTELEMLLSEGLVTRIPRPHDFDLIRLSGKGHANLPTPEANSPSPSAIDELLANPLDLPGFTPMTRDESHDRS